MARTHKSFEGKEIKVIGIWGDENTGIVTGCNRDIGLTIQKKDDLNNYLFCYHGPSSVTARKTPELIYDEKDTICFNNMIKMLTKGYFSAKEHVEFSREIGVIGSEYSFTSIASAEVCPFNQ